MSTESKLVGQMSDSDAVLWMVGRDPVLRSPILAVILLDEEPDWEAGLARVERLTAIEPRLRARAIAQPYGLGNPRWVDDGKFELAQHVHQVGAPLPEPSVVSLIWPSSWEPTRSTRNSRFGRQY